METTKQAKGGRPFTLDDAKRVQVVLERRHRDWLARHRNKSEALRAVIDAAIRHPAGPHAQPAGGGA